MSKAQRDQYDGPQLHPEHILQASARPTGLQHLKIQRNEGMRLDRSVPQSNGADCHEEHDHTRAGHRRFTTDVQTLIKKHASSV